MFNCKTCNKRLKNVYSCRKCPDAQFVQKILNEISDFNSTIYPDDQICNACYKDQLLLIKQEKDPQTSNDDDLKLLINNVKSDMPSIVPNDIEEMVMHAAKVIAIKVGEELLEQRALLPTAYEWFTSEVTQMLRLRNQSIPNTEPNHIASPQWLRSQISCLLKQHVAYFCKIKKYGTVLCRYGGDLLHSLNVALGQCNRGLISKYMYIIDLCLLKQRWLSMTLTSYNQ